MIKVLHYVGKMDRGGMETFIMNLYRNVDLNTMQFDFAVHGTRTGDYTNEIQALGGSFYKFPHMRKNPIAYRNAWRKFWKAHAAEYTAFHFHTNSLANIIAFEEAYKAGVPVRIVHSHSSFANKGKLQLLNNLLLKIHRRRVRKMATDLFACSDKAAKWLYGGDTLGAHTVQIVNNGIDLDAFAFDAQKRESLRKALGLEANTVIGHIGSFIPVKNHGFLLKVIQKAYEKDKGVRAVLIGDGALKAQTEAEASALGIADAVHFLGVRSDVKDLLSAMDVYVMPSLYEGLPVSLVEVQANGLPSIISDTITKTVRFKSNMEFISLSESADAWADRALQLADSASRIADNGVLIDNGYDVKEIAKKYMQMLKRNH